MLALPGCHLALPAGSSPVQGDATQPVLVGKGRAGFQPPDQLGNK